MTFGATVRAITKSTRLVPSRAAIYLTPAAIKKVSELTKGKGVEVRNVITATKFIYYI